MREYSLLCAYIIFWLGSESVEHLLGSIHKNFFFEEVFVYWVIPTITSHQFNGFIVAFVCPCYTIYGFFEPFLKEFVSSFVTNIYVFYFLLSCACQIIIKNHRFGTSLLSLPVIVLPEDFAALSSRHTILDPIIIILSIFCQLLFFLVSLLVLVAVFAVNLHRRRFWCLGFWAPWLGHSLVLL